MRITALGVCGATGPVSSLILDRGQSGVVQDKGELFWEEETQNL